MNELIQFFKINTLATAGASILAFLLAAILIGPFVGIASPLELNMAERLQPPGPGHWFGTDSFGRDMLARIIHGGRYTLAIGMGVVVVAFVVGVFFGTIAGFLGGIADMVIMRVVDAILSFPALVLAIALAAAFGPSLQNAMLAVASGQPERSGSA